MKLSLQIDQLPSFLGTVDRRGCIRGEEKKLIESTNGIKTQMEIYVRKEKAFGARK